MQVRTLGQGARGHYSAAKSSNVGLEYLGSLDHATQILKF